MYEASSQIVGDKYAGDSLIAIAIVWHAVR